MNGAGRSSRYSLRLSALGRALLAAALAAGYARTAAGDTETAPSLRESLVAVRKAGLPLDWSNVSAQMTDAIVDRRQAAYFNFYGLDLACASHHFGYVPVGSARIATHIYVPEGPPVGTVVAAHGYYDHSATWRHAIRALLDAQLAVVIYDQPGHGLSSGARAAIGDFSEYVEIMREIIHLTRNSLPGPTHIAAHSMGCAVSIDYLLHDPDAIAIENVVLVAPLIRSAHWHLSNGGNRIAKTFVKAVPRVFRKNSGDDTYLKFVERDPLHTHKVPLGWVDALRRWNRRAAQFAGGEGRTILIIQGTKDSTVDTDYNLPFLKHLFPARKLVIIPRGGHQLLNEAKPLRQKTLDAMCSFLTKGQP